MSTIKIATRYAKALLDEALEKNILEEIYSDVKSVQQSIAKSRELELFLKSPIIKSDKKSVIIEALFSDKVSVLMVGFINTMVDKKREGLLKDVTHAFENAYNAMKGITKVKLTTAVVVSSEIEQKLIDTIKTQFELTNIDVTKSVDAEIIGGYIVQFDDRIYDNSIAHKLNTVERSIII